MINWDKDKAIYFENIQQGFELYENEIVVMNEHEAFDFFKEKWKNAKEGSVYVDFYYSQLEEQAKAIVENELSEEEKEYIRKLDKGIIYPIDEMLLQIITQLNAKEILFSSIYFTGEVDERSTWWGNYNQEYVVFRKQVRK